MCPNCEWCDWATFDVLITVTPEVNNGTFKLVKVDISFYGKIANFCYITSYSQFDTDLALISRTSDNGMCANIQFQK